MTTYKIQAFVNVDPEYHFNPYREGQRLAPVENAAGEQVTFVIEEGDTSYALEAMYAVGNKQRLDAAGQLWPPDIRSLSTGDVLHIVEGPGREWCSVASFGFDDETEPDASDLVSLTGSWATSRK